MNILIIGCGYVGLRCAKQWIAAGHTVTALTRSESRTKEWMTLGIQPVIGNVLDVSSLKRLPAADVCLYAVGYDRAATADKRSVYVDGLTNVLREITDRIPRMIYVSSTSVYGQTQGEVINEDSPTLPDTEGGKICLDAEKIVQQHTRIDTTILRLSGIYGPNRMIARQEQLQTQTPVKANPDGWLNLVHIDDIILAIDRLVASPPKSTLYLLSDSHPLTRRDFYCQMSNLLDAPTPVFSFDDTSDIGKRCSNSKIIKELGLTLTHPTTTTGLRASITRVPLPPVN